MSITWIKQPQPSPPAAEIAVRDRVAGLLAELETGGEAAALRLSRELDHYHGDIVVQREAIERAAAQLPVRLKDDIRFAHDNVRRFAEAQREAIRDMQIEILPGLVAGHRNIALDSAGCYVPGGRYAHVASAIMSVTTARVAGVRSITACSPARGEAGIPPAVLYTLDLCGADRILTLGGVCGIAALAFGFFGAPPADILVGPGNEYVAEAKRLLFGRVAIDMLAGPTESLVIADASADPAIVAADLVGQAEHGWNSPVWLISLDRALAERVVAIVPGLIATLPQPNRGNAETAWRDFAEVIVVSTREEAATVSDDFASEHTHVQCADLDWWHARLRNYGSLFLGESTTVVFGDKVSGPNHILPTRRAARYTGGLSVGKFLKTVTFQRTNREATRALAPVATRISRAEAMEGHARSAEVRLSRWFDGESFDLQDPGEGVAVDRRPPD